MIVKLSRKSIAGLIAFAVIGAGAVYGLSSLDVVDPAQASALLVAALCATLIALNLETGSDLARASRDKKKRDGARDEVSQLAWSLFGRDQQVTFGAMKFVRNVAGDALAVHGLSLENPRDRARIEELLGATHTTALAGSATLDQRELEDLLGKLEHLTDPRPTGA